MIRLGCLVLAATLAGCVRPAPVADRPARYVVGPAYQAGGVWYYPQEQLSYDATGLAAVAADRSGSTATGQAFDQGVSAAAHQTLQLPAVIRVSNLENGRQLLVRLNDRGPANPGRLIELTRHAAGLLGIASGSATRVRVQLEESASRLLARRAGGGAAIQVVSAPRESVRQESLAPPPGAVASARTRVAAGGAAPLADGAADGADTAVPLTDTVQQGAAEPGQLWLQAGVFGRRTYADQLRAKLTGIGALVEREQRGRDETFRVRAGPFQTVANADSALDHALRAGVTDARIVVEQGR